MNKVYTRINWENEPSDKTPVNETNLNKMDFALNEVDNRLIEMDTTKLSKADSAKDIVNWTMDENTGVITITRRNGEKIIFDLNIEKIPVSFSLSDDGILTMVTDDGTTFTANIGAMIPILTFNNSDEISVSVSGTGINKTYSFSIKDNSITENKLQPNYLAAIKVEVAKAQASETAAATSEANALASENAAKISETNAKSSETSAKTSETNAKASETSAANSATSASTSATNASASATTATNKASEAANSATSASESADTATNKASEASTSATNANTYATKSQSYAVGGTGTRENEDVDNAQYYYQQAKSISESFSGALKPMGTVTFDNLPGLSNVTEGDMYNVSDQFTTTSSFKEGSGNTIPAGSNVYKTSDGFWDVLAGSPVTGVKGNAETSYRRGNVNITASNIGLGNVNNTSDANKPISTATQTALNGKLATNGDSKNNTVTFTSNDVADGSATSWTSVTALASGITHATFFQRVSQMFKNVRYLYKMLGTTNISSIGNGTVTGAISTLNSNLIIHKAATAFTFTVSSKTVGGGDVIIVIPKGYRPISFFVIPTNYATAIMSISAPNLEYGILEQETSIKPNLRIYNDYTQSLNFTGYVVCMCSKF